MMNIREAFAEAEILKDASPSVLADLASCASLRRVKCGSHLFLDKEEVTTLYVMVEGMQGVTLPEKAEVFKPLYWKGPHFDR